MVDYYIGTMGFSYRDWVGTFYPDGVGTRDYLSYYGRIFNAVEIDSTFYGIPKVSAVNRWRDQSPVDFKICLKVPRSITHKAALVDVENEMEVFLGALERLAEKLGVILIQFSPSFDNSNSGILSIFLEQLPKIKNFAVEFRHPSWYSRETAQLLASHGICWAATEYPGVPKEVDLTTDFMFIRLVGEHGRFRSHAREQIDVRPQISKWWGWIRSQTDRVQAVHVFINDDYSGHAPATANRLKALIGLPVIKPDIPRQMRFL